MNALEQAIHQKLTGDNLLMQKVANSNSVFSYSAPENAPLPVIVFFEQAATPSYTFNERGWQEWLYAIKAITEGNSMHIASEIDEAVDSLLTDATLTVDGEVTLYCRKESAIPKYVEIAGGVRYNHAGSEYRIWTR